VITALDQKIIAITPPGAIVDNASLTTASIDTKGYDWCDIYLLIGATDIAMAALKLQESDTDGSYADITGATFNGGTMSDGNTAALPAASGATGDNTFHAFRVNLKGRKRYLDLVATGGDGAAGAYFVAIAVLSRAKQVPATMSTRGLAQEIFV